ncbi:unnamed protein product [[Candida] boidinii]|nr:unnamed protein product [[Candida] boidinii]
MDIEKEKLEFLGNSNKNNIKNDSSFNEIDQDFEKNINFTINSHAIDDDFSYDYDEQKKREFQQQQQQQLNSSNEIPVSKSITVEDLFKSAKQNIIQTLDDQNVNINNISRSHKFRYKW